MPAIPSFTMEADVVDSYEGNYTLESTLSMTRLLYTPNRSGDVHTVTSANRSVSVNCIPNLDHYNSSPDITSHKDTVNHQQPRRHSYLQQKHISQSTSNIMSLLRDKPGRSGIPVSRSHSFGGMSIGSNVSAPSTHSVLGETMRRNSRGFLKPYIVPRSFRKTSKLPKVPRPGRALMVFESVKRGIREYINATHEDIAQLMATESATSTAQGRVLETDKQVKLAERFLRRLEFHLAKIDELHDHYVLNQQLREGARNMAMAFSASSSQNRKESIASIKCGYKECSQTMCAVEAQLENLLGSFSCQLKGIAGFARMVPGDVFEVVVRHGGQKWKTKGRIEKNSTQRWDQPDFIFKCLVGEMLSIKASEVRAFKSVLLGQKNCEICKPSSRDTINQGLFSAYPQLMTVNINVNGSLKLSIVVTWNPFDGVDESVTFWEPSIHLASHAIRKQPISLGSTRGSSFCSSTDLTSESTRNNLSPEHSWSQQDDSSIFGSATSLPIQVSSDSLHQTSSQSDSSWTTDCHTGRVRPHTIIVCESIKSHPTSDLFSVSRPQSAYMSPPASIMTSSSSSSQRSMPTSRTSLTSEVTQTMRPGLALQSIGPQDSSTTVEEALGNLTTTLEDFVGQYPELQKLEEVVRIIEALVRKTTAPRSRSVSMSISIEGAIEEAFEFLNTEDMLEDVDEEDESEAEERSNMTTHLSGIDQNIVSPSSTAKTADSGIESLAKRLQEDTQLGSSGGPSPIPPSSGSEQVDQALVFHLTYCDKLLENVGNHGPLKCRETYALVCLQNQAQILEKLVRIAEAENEVDLHAVLSEETSDKTLRELWVLCVDQTPLYVQSSKVVSVLEHRFGAKLSEQYDVRPDRIIQQLLSHMLYVTNFESSCHSIITLHQFMLFFKDGDVQTKLEGMAKECE